MLMPTPQFMKYVKWDKEWYWLHDWPVFVDFDESVIDRDGLDQLSGASPINRSSGRAARVRQRLRRVTAPDALTRRNITEFLQLVRELDHRPLILVVGGGQIGLGTDELYEAGDVDVIAFDIYGSPNVQFIADAHDIPMGDDVFDGVVVQAVLEHVLEPQVVVRELTRVLKPGGLAYAETPFMQQVHEGAYDFTRFTESGHRWLFREFDAVASGPVGGPGAQLIWSVASLVRGLIRSRSLARASRLLLFWLRFLDTVIPRAEQIDGAAGTYFLGRRSADGRGIRPRNAVEYYSGAQ